MTREEQRALAWAKMVVEVACDNDPHITGFHVLWVLGSKVDALLRDDVDQEQLAYEFANASDASVT